MSDKPNVLWYGAATDPSGYGEATRNYILGLDAIGQMNLKLQNRMFWRGDKLDLVDILPKLEKLSTRQLPEDLSNSMVVFNLTPEQYFVQRGVKKFVGVTTFETDGIPAQWLLYMRAMDAIVTYSKFNVETFRNSGVNVPIHIVPHGVDVNRFRPEGAVIDSLHKRIAGRFAFGSNFDWGDRKNPTALLSAYYNAFTNRDNVVLVLKVYHQYPIEKSMETVKNNIAAIKQGLFANRSDLPPVLLVTDIIRSVDMPAFYRTLNAYVLVSRGEGWSLTHTEAMSTGLPTVGTNWSGNTEFMDDSNSWLIDYTLEKIKDEQVAHIPHYRSQSWASAKVSHLTEVMRVIYRNDAAVKAKAAKARQDMCDKWTWTTACQKMNDLLLQIYNS